VKIPRLAIIVLSASLWCLFPFCGGGTVRLEDLKLRSVDLPDHGVKLAIPGNWSDTPGVHFHYIATGQGPNNLPATIEYRGLETEHTDATGKALYAQGWYEAIARNYDQKEDDARYRDWKYNSRGKIETDPEGAFEFEGTYRAGAIVYRKIGKLRFRGNRVHAIYYTAPDQDFRPTRRLFETIDQLHEFFPPVLQGEPKKR
jgi:hypothetical protein